MKESVLALNCNSSQEDRANLKGVARQYLDFSLVKDSQIVEFLEELEKEEPDIALLHDIFESKLKELSVVSNAPQFPSQMVGAVNEEVEGVESVEDITALQKLFKKRVGGLPSTKEVLPLIDEEVVSFMAESIFLLKNGVAKEKAHGVFTNHLNQRRDAELVQSKKDFPRSPILVEVVNHLGEKEELSIQSFEELMAFPYLNENQKEFLALTCNQTPQNLAIGLLNQDLDGSFPLFHFGGSNKLSINIDDQGKPKEAHLSRFLAFNKMVIEDDGPVLKLGVLQEASMDLSAISDSSKVSAFVSECEIPNQNVSLQFVDTEFAMQDRELIFQGALGSELVKKEEVEKSGLVNPLMEAAYTYILHARSSYSPEESKQYAQEVSKYFKPFIENQLQQETLEVLLESKLREMEEKPALGVVKNEFKEMIDGVHSKGCVVMLQEAFLQEVQKVVEQTPEGKMVSTKEIDLLAKEGAKIFAPLCQDDPNRLKTLESGMAHIVRKELLSAEKLGIVDHIKRAFTSFCHKICGNEVKEIINPAVEDVNLESKAKGESFAAKVQSRRASQHEAPVTGGLGMY